MQVKQCRSSSSAPFGSDSERSSAREKQVPPVGEQADTAAGGGGGGGVVEEPPLLHATRSRTRRRTRRTPSGRLAPFLGCEQLPHHELDDDEADGHQHGRD